jgi:hypothetical protein
MPNDYDTFSVRCEVSNTPASSTVTFALYGLVYQPPIVVTLSATSITGAGATVSGNVTDLGIPSVNCDLWGFEWGTVTGVYTDNWEDTGSMGAGVIFSTTITGGTAGVTYYYRAFARNPYSGYGYGAEENFTCLIASCVTDFTAYPNGCGRIDLYWYDPNDVAVFPDARVIIRVSEWEYPDTPPVTPPGDFSTEIYNHPVSFGDNTFSNTGLESGVTYYYRVWVYDSATPYHLCGQDLATTYPCGPTTLPDTPPEWFQDPSCEMYYQTILWPAMNYAIGMYEFPEEYFCMMVTYFMISVCCISSLPVAVTATAGSPKSMMVPFALGGTLIFATALAGALPLGISIVSFLVLGGIAIFIWNKA